MPNETELTKVKPEENFEGGVVAEPQEEHEKFDNQPEYWLACLGFAVGFGNVWRFPYMCYSNGGAAFFVPYLIALFFIAMPMYLVETSFGQLIQCKIHQKFAIINPRFWGVTVA